MNFSEICICRAKIVNLFGCAHDILSNQCDYFPPINGHVYDLNFIQRDIEYFLMHMKCNSCLASNEDSKRIQTFSIIHVSINNSPGPTTWNKNFPIAEGSRQSPIDIVPSKAVFDSDLTASDSLRVDYTPEDEAHLQNNGHSVMCQITKTGCKRDAILLWRMLK